MRARHRLSKLLLRHGIVYSGGSAWTGAHGVWLRQHARGRLPSATSQVAFDTCYDAVLMVTARRDRLDTQIEALAADCEFTPIVRRLGCLRGIGTLTGFALAVEIGDWHRFTGRSIGSFVGLTPSEHSFRRHPRARRDHQDRQQPRPPPAGRSRLHHRTRYIVSKTLLGRWELASPAARARGDAGNRRLHDRWIRFAARGKWSVIANIAIARELAGWCWSLAVLDDP